MDIGSEIPLPTPEVIKGPRITDLQKQILEAEGKPIRLGKRINNKPLYLSVINQRFSPHPEERKSLERPRFDPSLEPEQAVDGIAFINVYTGEDEKKLTPIGRYYWFLRGDTACGGPGPFQQKYLSEVDLGQSEELKKSFEWWNNSMTTTEVDENYRGEGIGSFMLAASFANLDLLGFKKFDAWNLTDDARHLWQKFWKWDKTRYESPGNVRPDTSHITVQDILCKPVTDQAVTQFL